MPRSQRHVLQQLAVTVGLLQRPVGDPQVAVAPGTYDCASRVAAAERAPFPAVGPAGAFEGAVEHIVSGGREQEKSGAQKKNRSKKLHGGSF